LILQSKHITSAFESKCMMGAWSGRRWWLLFIGIKGMTLTEPVRVPALTAFCRNLKTLKRLTLVLEVLK
jgi:hypothetical protein